MSFLRVYDQVANVVRSGGKTRRAAKMNTIRDWHGDIEEFIDAKQLEEKKAWALIEQGYDGSYNGDAYGSVMYQNENLSVRVSDEFMQSAQDGGDWWTRAVTTGEKLEKKDATGLLNKISEGTWVCGDPGIQYDGAIQKWHTCSGTEPIHSTNPCSEYVFINNTACNLASLNLMRFKRDDGVFEIDRFKAAVRIFITAQEILVDNASYPTQPIAENSHIFRTLGLGFANSGLAGHELRAAVRLERRPRTGRRDHVDHDRPFVRAIGGAGRRERRVRRLSRCQLQSAWPSRWPRTTSSRCAAS